jgi:hypothetical protein
MDPRFRGGDDEGDFHSLGQVEDPLTARNDTAESGATIGLNLPTFSDKIVRAEVPKPTPNAQ